MDYAEVRQMSVNVTPLHDRVLVRRLEEKETAKGGIIIPDTAKEKPQEGEVMAIGAGKMEKGHRIPLDVKVGDRILFGKYTGNDIKYSWSWILMSLPGYLRNRIRSPTFTSSGMRWPFSILPAPMAITSPS